MKIYCDVCHKTIKLNSEKKLLQSLSHIEFDESIR